MAVKLPVLQNCERLHARLTAERCAERHRRAVEGDWWQQVESLEVCKTCPVGAKNASAVTDASVSS